MLRSKYIYSLSAAMLLAACKGTPEDTGEPNTQPVANAGDDQSVSADQSVVLNGAASFDQDGDELTYHWGFEHLPEGSTLAEKEMPFTANASAEAIDTTFSPDAIGTYVVTLTVSDGRTESEVDHLIVKAEVPSTSPTAVAGDNIVGEVGQAASLDGSSSFDPNGRDLTFAWSLVQKPTDSAATGATDASSATTDFTPDARGVYIFNLVVNNGLIDSQPDAVIVTATGDDNSPVSSAGEDVAAEDCSFIQLDGAASADPDGDTLQYFWELQSKPTGSAASNSNFSDRNIASPTFWGDWAGEYVLSLTVNDGANWSLADMVTITLSERAANTAPQVEISTIATVSAGEVECEEDGYVYDCEDCDDQTIEMGPNVTITDADSDPYTVQWELTSGSGIIASPNSVTTNVKLENIEATEPNVCDSNEWVLELTVTDCTTASTKTSTTVTVDCCGIEATTTSSGN